jgi:hypothetical protein
MTTDHAQQQADIIGMTRAEQVHGSGALSDAEILAQYALINAREAKPIPAKQSSVEPVGHIDPAQAVRGVVMFGAVLAVGSVAVVSVVEVCAAVAAFIHAKAMAIGGGAFALLLLWAAVSGKRAVNESTTNQSAGSGQGCACGGNIYVTQVNGNGNQTSK